MASRSAIFKKPMYKIGLKWLFYNIIYICKVTSNYKCSNKCSGVKVKYLDLTCSGVEVNLLEIGNTQLMFKFLQIVLKYSMYDTECTTLLKPVVSPLHVQWRLSVISSPPNST